MFKSRLPFLLLFLAAFSVSCIILDGKWKDNIKLSVKNVEFKATADSVTITTKGEWWWVTDVSVDGQNYYNFGIDITGDSYKISGNCFTVEKRNKTTLFIKLDENPLPVKRVVTVSLEAGDYFDRVTINQAAKISATPRSGHLQNTFDL